MKVFNWRKLLCLWGLSMNFYFLNHFYLLFLIRLLSLNCPFTHERRSQILKDHLTRLYPAVFFRFVVSWSCFCVGRLVWEQVNKKSRVLCLTPEYHTITYATNNCPKCGNLKSTAYNFWAKIMTLLTHENWFVASVTEADRIIKEPCKRPCLELTVE